MISRSIVAMLVVTGAAAPASAAPQQPPSVNEELVVTANRVEEQRKNVPVEMTVITAEDIERSSARTIDDVLRLVPGFGTVRQGSSLAARATVLSTSLRGLGGSSSSRTLVLLDGVPLNNPVTGVVPWPGISLDNVERVEVVKSATGVWGNLAMGGVINIITKSAASHEPALNVKASAGTQETGEAQAGLRLSRAGYGMSLSTSYLTTGGSRAIRADQAGPVDGNVSNAVRTFDAKIGARGPSRSWSVAASAFSENMQSGSPLAVEQPRGGLVRANAEFGAPNGGRWQFAGFVNRQNLHSVLTTIAADRKSETPSSDQIAVPGTAAGGSAQWSKPLTKAHLINAGVDAEWTKAEIHEDFNFVASLGQLTRRRDEQGRQLFAGLFVEDLFEITARWRLTAAIRVDGWQTRPAFRREIDKATGTVLRVDQYASRRSLALDPSIGTVVHASDWLSLRGAVNRAFRAPTPGELYRPFRARGGVITESNPALIPERLLGAEAGVDVGASSRLVARTTFFSNWLDDPIITATIEAAGPTSRNIPPCGVVSAFGVCRQTRNAGRLWSGGADVELEFRPATAFAVTLSYMYNRSRVIDAPGQPQLVGKMNRQSPAHQGVLEAVYLNPRVARITVDLRVVGRRFEDDINTIAIAPFVSIDVNVARAISHQLTVFVTAQNLLNRVNELTHTDDGVYSVTGPRQVNAGLRLRF